MAKIEISKEQEAKLLELLKRENELREQFRQKRAELEALVQPITNHVEECADFWQQNFPEKEMINIINIKEEYAIKVTKPIKEVALVETYLPYGIDYEMMQYIECI